MEGYKPKRKKYILEFPGHPGLEVSCKGTTIGKIFDLQKMNIKLGQTSEEDIAKVFGLLADHIITWNVVHPELEQIELSIDEEHVICGKCGLEEDAPVPTTVEHFMCLDLEFLMHILFGWIQAVATMPDPKGLTSNNGGSTGLEAAMERLASMQNQGTL